MFICKDCLTEKYTQEPGTYQSYGACEDCGTVTGCSDIPSKYLTYKRSYARQNFPAEIDKLTEMGIVSRRES